MIRYTAPGVFACPPPFLLQEPLFFISSAMLLLMRWQYLLWYDLICLILLDLLDNVANLVSILYLSCSFLSIKVLFYWMHRLAHHRLFYRHVHKVIIAFSTSLVLGLESVIREGDMIRYCPTLSHIVHQLFEIASLQHAILSLSHPDSWNYQRISHSLIALYWQQMTQVHPCFFCKIMQSHFSVHEMTMTT